MGIFPNMVGWGVFPNPILRKKSEMIPYFFLRVYLNNPITQLWYSWSVVHKSCDVLPSWADPGSCGHKRVYYNFLNRRDKWPK